MSKEEVKPGEAPGPNQQTGHAQDGKVQKQDAQFQTIGQVVENDDDTGVVEVESLCMNCHENVSSYCHCLANVFWVRF